MSTDKISYHKAAGELLKKYYESNTVNSILYTYRFLSRLASEAKEISKEMSLKHMDYQNVMVATWFRYAGFSDVSTGWTTSMKTLLTDYFHETNYPADQRIIVENAIDKVANNTYSASSVEEIISDSVNSMLADHNFLEFVILIRDELNRINSSDHTELYYLQYFVSLFVKIRYYTPYADEKYSLLKQKNFELVEKRISKLEDEQRKEDKIKIKTTGTLMLTNEETEDLFKIAFRNYNHLISVADTKASLLIRVNAIIISIMIAFVIGKIGKSLFILWPTIILLSVCMVTILLAILASRPQNNSFLADQKSHSYQQFFFGSFDMVDPAFLHEQWENYFKQLVDLFNKPKEIVYMEYYKESFNVRKVLSKKFNYLSLAYWVFLLGLLVSVIAFVVGIYKNR